MPTRRRGHPTFGVWGLDNKTGVFCGTRGPRAAQGHLIQHACEAINSIAISAMLSSARAPKDPELQLQPRSRGLVFAAQLVHQLCRAGHRIDRADALAGWVNHFLLGLGMTQPKLDKVKDETGEAIDDLRNIAQLGYDEDEDQEELEMSLEEIIEYVRVAALLCHDTFTRQQPTAPEVRKPTLH